MKKNFLENRIIRVFISSTFKDMQAERDYLVKKVFPVLKEKAERRGVALVTVDLRWGITEEESKCGRVLDICLKEIDNSYPFFLGILGNRYGWCPGKKDIQVMAGQYEWLRNDIEAGLSITEIEMRYGVLRNPKEMNAHFYIKRDECPAEQIDSPDKLWRLKGDIRNNGRYPVEDYHSVEDLGTRVISAFVSLLDRLFPEDSKSDVRKERQEHMSNLTRLLRFYIPDRTGYETLSRFLGGKAKIGVIGGRKGCGKSALVANWLFSEEGRSGFQFVYHQCGVGESGDDPERCVARIETEADLLTMPSILVVDGFPEESSWRPLSNYLFARKSYGGRPIALSSFDKVIVIDRFCSKDTWDCDCYYEVRDNPDKEHWRRFIEEYLRIFRKRLSVEQIERILSNPIFRNASLMKMLLDEIISFGSYDRLSEHINYLCRVSNEEGFYQNLLALFEQEYGETLVRTVLCLLIVSREGIPEDFLIAVSDCSRLEWSQFYCSLKNLLTPSGANIHLGDSGLVGAAIRKYGLDDVSMLNQYRHQLLRMTRIKKSPYAFIESCHQLQKLELYDVLTPFAFEGQSDYHVSETDYLRALFDLKERECRRAEGMDGEQFRFVVSIESVLLPSLFNRFSEGDESMLLELSRTTADLPFLLENCQMIDDDASFDEEREHLMQLYALSKEKLTALIDNPKIVHQRRFEDMLAELDGDIL